MPLRSAERPRDRDNLALPVRFRADVSRTVTACSLLSPWCMSDSPVQVDVISPERFDRVQLLLRVGISVVMAIVGVTTAWLVGLMFVALPVIAAVAISVEGTDGYHAKVAPKVWSVLAWLLALSAYMSILVDRFPTEERGIKAAIRFTGRPTVGSALVRLLTSIPSGFVLSLLWCVSGLLCFIAVLFVLVTTSVPSSLLAFQRGVLRWNARLVAYHASLVDDYPPWSFDTDLSGDNPAGTASTSLPSAGSA